MPDSPAKHLARVTLRQIVRALLSLRAQDYVISPETVTLVVAPHQDDETLGCGGLIAAKRLVASPVHVVYLTDGAASHTGHPTLTPAALAGRRVTEARAALRRLGVEQAAIHFLGAPDGRLDRLDRLDRLADEERSALVTRLAQLIKAIRPAEILLPFRHDGSSEHEAAFRLFAASLAQSGHSARVLEFPVWCWWNPRLLLRALGRIRRVSRYRFYGYGFLKAAALAEYGSQIRATPPWTSPLLSADFVAAFSVEEEFFFET
jgi:LmbE family N-acetylglucosaminyl deacetylase